MSENGHGAKKSLIGEAFELLDDQLELASLEWRYEKSHSRSRLVALFCGMVIAVSAFSLLMVTAVLGLASMGFTLIQSCLILAVIFGIVAAILILGYTQRDPRAGPPFQGTREEARKNIEWIRRFF